MSSDVTCPTCGTISHLDDLNRDAMAFCRVCDYPLFWTSATSRGEAEADWSRDPGLRRLPGTAGLVTIAMLGCPTCTEPNPVIGIYCIRCGDELHPRPVVAAAPVPPPEPLPEPEPVPPKPDRLPGAWVPALVMTVALVLFCLVAGAVLLLR